MPRKLRLYWQALPDIFTYQILTKSLIGIWVYLLGLITDNVKQAAEVEELLEQKSDLQRMVDWIMAAVG